MLASGVTMSTHETEQQGVPAPQAREREPSHAPTGLVSDLIELASRVGNNAFSRVIARQPAATSGPPSDGSAFRPDGELMLMRAMQPRARAVARQPKPPQPGGDTGEEEPGLDESQKGRMTALCVKPLRSAAGRLGAGEKADVRSVVRHLRPVVTALNGFSAKGSARETILASAEEVSMSITVLDSLNLSHKQAIFLARTAWQTARRHLAATKAQIKVPKDAPRTTWALPRRAEPISTLSPSRSRPRPRISRRRRERRRASSRSWRRRPP